MSEYVFEGSIRALLYPALFESDLMDAVDWVLSSIVDAAVLDMTPSDYLEAIRLAVASDRDLAGLLDDPHSDGAIRSFLREIARRLEERQGPSSAQVSFSVAVAFTIWGENVHVVGDAPGLGGWNPVHAVRLAPWAYPTWSGSAAIAQGTAIQFKFIKIDGSGHVTWEGGGNRTFTVPKAQAGSYSGSWQ